MCDYRGSVHAPVSRTAGALRASGERRKHPHRRSALIRQQAHEIDNLWDRLSRAYALVRRASSPAEMIQEEMEQLRAMLDEGERFTIQEVGLKRLKLHSRSRSATCVF